MDRNLAQRRQTGTAIAIQQAGLEDEPQDRTLPLRLVLGVQSAYQDNQIAGPIADRFSGVSSATKIR